MDYMKVDALFIVKNEEHNIAKSIESIKEGVDNIIIVDTGSTDNTIEICEKLGCRVVNYVWENDFSKARNFALSQTDADWILFLDADEYFETPLDNTFKNYIQGLNDNNVDMIRILTYNIDTAKNTTLSTVYGLKLFKNTPDIYYIRPIHEYLTFSKEKVNCGLLTQCPLIHTGYSSNILKTKPERNVEILENKKDKDTMDYYYLVRENLSLRRYKDAEKYLDMFFKQSDCQEKINNMDIGYMIYSYKYMLMCNNTKYSITDIENFLLETIEKYNIPDFHYHLGCLFLNKNFAKSKEYFLDTIKCHKEVNMLDKSNNYNGYEANIYYNLAQIEYCQRNNKQALTYIMRACSIDKRNDVYLYLLAKLCNKMSSKKAISLFYNAYNPKNKKDYEYLTSHLVNTNLKDVFKYFALEYNTKYDGNHTAVFIAMALYGQYETALNTLLGLYNRSHNKYYLDVLTIILLYIDDSKYYTRYYRYLNNLDKNIINAILENDISKIDNMQGFVNILIRLLYLGKKKCLSVLYNQKIDDELLIRVFNCLNNISAYKEMIKLFENSLSKNISCIHKYLFALYMTGKQDKMVKQYYCFVDEGIDLSSCEYLLHL